MGRIIVLVCIILLVVGGVWWWHNTHSGNLYDGSVVRRDAAMENGTTTMENGQNLGEEAHPTPSRSDAPGTINGEPVNANRSDLDTQTTPITVDPFGPAGSTAPSASTGSNAPYASTGSNMPYPPPAGQHVHGPGAPEISYSPTTPPYPPPAFDSQTPNAPNGYRFAGSGSFQWYRQGNLTYRVDTRSGRSCIIYATMEEWRKPFVYNNGCRAS